MIYKIYKYSIYNIYLHQFLKKEHFYLNIINLFINKKIFMNKKLKKIKL